MSRNETAPEKSGIDDLIKTLCKIRQPDKMQQLLEEILTPTEYHDLAMRWELMQRLLEGSTQRKIANDLRISLCKITRGAKILKQKGAVTKKYLKKRRPT